MTAAWLADLLAAERLPPAYAGEVERVHAPLADALAADARRRPGLVVGVCGTQASGKSTMTAVLARLLAERGLRAAPLALDDLYLPRADRRRLAATVHPLLATRGVPGTHDVALGHAVLDALPRPGRVAVPRFEKAADDRAREAEWPVVEGPADVVLFEGWCVGARPQDEGAFAAPVNALEREEDPDGRWRRFANDALAGPYQSLFSRLDRLVMLKAPSFEVVLRWRTEQEHKLRDRLRAEGDLRRSMSDDEVARFIVHYERLTRWILEEMPPRADWLVELDAERRGRLREREGMVDAVGIEPTTPPV